MMHTRHIIVLDLDDASTTKWKLHITRENNSSSLIFALHWDDKPIPTHYGVQDIKDFMDAMKVLLANQVST